MAKKKSPNQTGNDPHSVGTGTKKKSNNTSQQVKKNASGKHSSRQSSAGGVHPQPGSKTQGKRKTAVDSSRDPHTSEGGAAHSGSHAKTTRIVEYHKPVSINIGFVFFAVILIYVAYSIIRYATTEQVVAYEVRTGSISNNSIYEGLALRDEKVMTSDYAGYVNYYTSELDRLATGDLACTIDESGEVQTYLAQTSSEDTILTSDDYVTIAQEIMEFEEGFEPSYFSTIYDFKTSLSSTIQKITNSSILSEVERIADSASLHYMYTDDTGYILYSYDGYEDLAFEDLTLSSFDSANYESNDMENNQLVSAGEVVYRLALNEDWSIIILSQSEEEVDMLVEESVVKVKFLKNQYEAWATIGQTKEVDDYWMVELTFTNSMMAFATDRFINIEIITDDEEGLKIPKSALIDDEFYAIPREYVTTGPTGAQGVLLRVVDSDGVTSSEFTEVTPYEKDDDEENYYISQDILSENDVLIKPDSSETLTVDDDMLDTLTGVYNINEGYADFKQVTKITENDEYAIVQSNTTYGLREYDHIVLDASTISPNEFLYE